MKRQVIQNFLNLPGIVGVALMDGRTRPFFHGLDITLNFQQQDALAQGIQQVVSTTPAEFEAFSFRFISHQAHIYRLPQGVILLVLTADQVPFEDYLTVLRQLQATLVEDLSNAVNTFRLLASSITLSNQPYWAKDAIAQSISPLNPPAAGSLLDNSTEFLAATSEPPAVQCEDVVNALNHLSDFTTQYLGKVIVANAWKSARPAHSWLEAFEIDRSGHFKLVAQASLSGQDPLTPEQHQWLKDWVHGFVAHCGKTIRNFATLVPEKALDPNQKALLFAQDPPTP